ncbi:hypothetical protein PGT21_019153 [Puccinia graminis f. sp. tritici]|uniref:Uncharacterized protein n=1 Tax=Puccinia graminis f. sp. tritici TaxID=56615 RepID=A0A5B0PLJ1_PUCGR|nr:hypothetical protein PGT21_019153 [Puccinia graminis f. sp. tritici]
MTYPFQNPLTSYSGPSSSTHHPRATSRERSSAGLDSISHRPATEYLRIVVDPTNHGQSVKPDEIGSGSGPLSAIFLLSAPERTSRYSIQRQLASAHLGAAEWMRLHGARGC